MAQSALRGLVSGLMQGGPAPAGMASAQTAIQNAAQRPQPKPMGQQVADVLGGVALPLSAVPFVGDVAGLGADAAMYASYPEERTALNYGMTLAGMLPFVPGAAGIRSAQGAAEGALDMSQAARMQRAASQGYLPQTFYHGTKGDFESFDPLRVGQSDYGSVGRGYYVSENPDTANMYAQLSSGESGPNVIASKVALKNLANYDDLPHITSAERSKAITENLKAMGHDGIVKYAKDGTIEELVVFDRANIRSVNAAFDPAKRGSADLMAGTAGAAVGLSALRQLMPQQEQE